MTTLTTPITQTTLTTLTTPTTVTTLTAPSLNVIKTEYILLCSNFKLAKQTKFNIDYKMGNDPIKRVKAGKSLGVYID